MRRYGEPVLTSKPYRRRPGAYGILMRGSEVLLTHQIAPTAELQLPGGGIDPGESPVRALYREVYEETGWRIGAPRRVGAYRRFTYMPEYDLWAEKVCTIYLAYPVRRVSEPTEAGHTAVWMPAVDAVELLDNEGDAAMLADVIALFGTA